MEVSRLTDALSKPAPTRPRQSRYLGLAIVAFALLVRVGYALKLHNIALYGDMVHYDHSALTLIAKHTFSYWGNEATAQVTPGYPLFLAICYEVARLATHSHQGALRIAALVQAVLSALSVGLLYQIARNVLKPSFAAIAALLLALYPPAEWAVGLMLTETLFVFLFLLYVDLFFRARRTNRISVWLLCGLSLGLATLVRPSVFPLLLAPLLLFTARIRTASDPARVIALAPRRLWMFLTYVLGFVIPMIPWWIRNAVTLHRLLLTSDDMGNPLLYGSDPNFAHDLSLSAGLTADQQKTLAIHRIEFGFSHHPFANLEWYTVGKLKDLFGTPWYLGHTGTAGTLAMLFSFWLHFHLVWVLLGAVGLIWGAFHRDMRWITALAAYCTLVQLPFIPINRYAFPVMPFLFIGVAFLLARGRSERISGAKV